MNNDSPERAISILAIISALLDRRRALAWAAGVAVASTLLIRIAVPREFEARASFYLASSDGASGANALSGLAGRLTGLSSGTTGSVSLFSEVATSERILREVLADTVRSNKGKMQLLDLLADSNPDTESRTSEATRYLRRRVSKAVSRESGLVTLTLTLRDPVAAASALNSMTRSIAAFELRERQARASDRARFLSRQLSISGDSLQAAENDLERFVQANRLWEQSASLTLEHDRRERAIQLQRQTFVNLSSQLTQAALESDSQVSAIVPVDTATAPSSPSNTRLYVVFLLLLATCLLGSTVFVLASTAWREELQRGNAEAIRLAAHLDSLRRRR